ncbi:ABC transporter permease [Ornithinicoccus halotolerans]|uniref:ABC transporter permease n=1 Tax=Ornithinicoccus halotolerans TaxID=1748220 RepID=UPI0012965D02|nr:ABC transporter permease [Ornithinicoccus halotolerans]
MIRLVRAELAKLTTTRLWWGMGLALLLSGVALAALVAFFLTHGSVPGLGEGLEITDTLPALALARMVYTGAAQIGYLLTLVVGVVVIGQELRHRTATTTFLAEPRRGRVVAAKAVALAVAGLAGGSLLVAGALLGGGTVLALGDLPVFPDAGLLLRTLLLQVVALALWALIGLGAGVLIPHQVAALFVAVAAAWIVEPLLAWGLSFLDWGDGLAQYFPSQATLAAMDVYSDIDPRIAAAMGASPEQLPWWGGLLVLAGYAAVMTLAGIWLTRRRDVL